MEKRPLERQAGDNSVEFSRIWRRQITWTVYFDKGALLMSAIKWFRKNNKKLLAVLVIPLMIIFLLPSFVGKNQGGGPDVQVLAHFLDREGREQELTTVMKGRAKRELEILRGAGIGEMAQMGALPDLRAVGGVQIAVVQQLLFPERRFGQALRGVLNQLVDQDEWASDPERREVITELVDQVVNSSSDDASLCYILLREEARRLGIEARADQITAVLGARMSQEVAGRLGGFSIRAMTQGYKITEGDLRRAIGNYIAIVRAGHMATGLVGMSEAELKQKVFEKFELGNVSGDYVILGADQMLEKVGDFKEADLEALFAEHRLFERGQVSQDNPHGIGYMLGDRVQVEYLAVDLEAAEKTVAAEFAAMTPKEQEDTVQDFWQDNKYMFREAVPAVADSEGQVGVATYRDPDFDEVADQAQLFWQRDEAGSRAELILGDAKRLAVKAMVGKKVDELSAGDVIDYSELAGEVGSEAIAVVVGKSDYLSRESAADFLSFGNAFVMRKGQRQQGLLQTLFDSKPLHEGTVVRFELPPVSLFEDFGPVVGFGFSEEPVAVYLIRIVGVDKAREPVSINDDGRQGSGEKEVLIRPEGSDLLELVKADWRQKQAFEIACGQGEKLAESAQDNWDAALAAMKSFVSDDPCEATGVVVASLDQIRSQISQAKQFAEQFAQVNPAQGAFFANLIAERQKFLARVVEFARTRGEEAGAIGLMKLADSYECVVIKDLKVTPPSEAEYLLRRPLVAREELVRKQQIAVLTHYNPTNIRDRSGYKLRAGDDQ